MSRPHYRPALSRAGAGEGYPSRGYPSRRQLGNVLYTRQPYPDLDRVLSEMARLVREYQSRPVVRDLAVKLSRGVRDMRRPQPIAHAVYRWVRRNIRYVLDPAGTELLQSPDVTLRNGYADCDGMTVLAAALLSAVGVEVGFEAIAQRERGEYDHVYLVYRRADGRTGYLDPTRRHAPGPTNPNPRILSRKTIWLADMKTTMSGPRGLGVVRDDNGNGSSDGASITTTAAGERPPWYDVLESGIETLPDLVQAFRGSPDDFQNNGNGQTQLPDVLPPQNQQTRILGMSPAGLLLTAGGTIGGIWLLNKVMS